MNTNIFLEDDCLRTTIRCSQVCHTWRSLLLSTPSIWGRLLHLGELSTTSNTGRDEILTRSRSSLLWVSGSIYVPINREDQTLLFLLKSVLHPNWDRIEYLNLAIQSPSEEDFWPILQRPAPNLRSFSFSAKSSKLLVSTTEAQPLFSNHAPLLRRFSADCLPIDLSSVWIRHLRQITLCHRFTVREILICLRLTPLVEDLLISDIPTMILPPADPLPSAFLPKLSKISLQNIDICNCALFLDQIHSAEGCAVNFKPRVNYPLDDYLKIVDLEGPLPSLSSYLASYLHAHHSQIQEVEIHLALGPAFRLECSPQRLSDIGRFRVAVTPSPRFPRPTRLHNSMLSLFSGCDFSFVTTLKFNLPPSMFASHNSNETYLPYFLLFPFVTDLLVSEETLQSILIISTSHGLDITIFPVLQTVTVTTFDEVCSSLRPLLRFLRHRKKNGIPVKKLIYYVSELYRPNLRGLEEMTGLRVCRRGLNKEVEYVC